MAYKPERAPGAAWHREGAAHDPQAGMSTAGLPINHRG